MPRAPDRRPDRPPTRRSLPSILAVGLTLAGALAPASAQDPPRTSQSGAANRVQPAPGGLLRNIWWNQDAVIESLSLQPLQRAKMDGHFKRFQKTRDETQDALSENQKRFADALEAGSFDHARQLNDEMAERVGRVTVAQRQLKVEVLALLTPEQLATFRTEYPHLIRQAWFRRMGMGPG